VDTRIDVRGADRVVYDLRGLTVGTKAMQVNIESRLAAKVAAEARRRAPVRTGRLRSGITVGAVGGKAVVRSVVPGRPYNVFQEEGTSRNRARRFMAGAVEALSDREAERIAQQAVDGSLRAAGF
jgi:HK97 gp10 family phage protein